MPDLQHTGTPVSVSHPAFSGEGLRYTAEHLPNNSDLTTARTIEAMSLYIREDANSQEVAAAVLAAIGRFTGTEGALDLIFNWVTNAITFEQDSMNAARMSSTPAPADEIELLIRPRDLLRMSPRVGDCDDFSMLTAAMLMHAGINCELVTIAADPRHPNDFSHVYVGAVLEDGTHTPLDTSHGPRVGWEYPTATRRLVWPIAPASAHRGTMNGLGSALLDDQLRNSTLIAPAGQGTAARIIENISKGGMQILAGRYGQAPAIQYSGNGVQYTQYQPQPFFPVPGLPGGQSGTGWLLIAGVVVAAVMILKGRN